MSFPFRAKVRPDTFSLIDYRQAEDMDSSEAWSHDCGDGQRRGLQCARGRAGAWRRRARDGRRHM